MKINTDTQPLDATGEDLPSGRENVAVSAFCFYGFFFFLSSRNLFQGIFSASLASESRGMTEKIGVTLIG